MNNQRSFHHHKLINIAIGTVVYGTTALIGTCLIAILIEVFTNGAPTSFGIYG